MKTPSRTGVRAELQEMIQAIGGEGVLFSVLEKFYDRMSTDVLIGFFFDGKDLKKIAHHQGQFILTAAGLNLNYTGHSPSSAHLGLAPILSGHFNRRIVLLKEVLQEENFTPEQIERWVQFEQSFRNVVVAPSP